MYQIYVILEWHSTCFGLSFRPSSGVKDCTYSNRYMSNRYCCLLASKQTAVSVCLLASRKQYLFDIYLLLYVQSLTPDDGRKDSPKHVYCYMKREDQQDATITCLSLTSVSTCFGHHYAHLQENKGPVTAFGVLFWFCWMWLVAVVGRCVVGCEQCLKRRNKWVKLKMEELER